MHEDTFLLCPADIDSKHFFCVYKLNSRKDTFNYTVVYNYVAVACAFNRNLILCVAAKSIHYNLPSQETTALVL